jgi:holo-[acyl-carrier protein] synthase
MIYGIGTDIARIARFEEGLAKHGERFAARILAADELVDFRATNAPARFLAKRFAAKEAFGKAFGTGVREPATLLSMQVVHDDLGRPSMQCDEALAAAMSAKALSAHLSISDEADYAVAFVVIERLAP